MGMAEARLGPGPAPAPGSMRPMARSGQAVASLGQELMAQGADVAAQVVGWTGEGLLLPQALDSVESFTDPESVLITCEIYPSAQ